VEISIATKAIEFISKTTDFYPNPVRTVLYIKNSDSNASYAIYDLQGRKVMNGLMNNGPIDVSNLDTGLYTIVIIDDKDIRASKFIKE